MKSLVRAYGQGKLKEVMLLKVTHSHMDTSIYLLLMTAHFASDLLCNPWLVPVGIYFSLPEFGLQ